jgi:dihydropteroate synthase
VGPSRKSFVGAVLDLPVERRLMGTAAAVAACVLGGAHVVRVHDVLPVARAARVADALAHAATRPDNTPLQQRS